MFSDKTIKRDFETGQNAALIGKHSDDCPFRLPARRAAWQRGFREAMYNNEQPSKPIYSRSAQRHVDEIRKRINIHK